jgi:hypothetical protein
MARVLESVLLVLGVVALPFVAGPFSALLSVGWVVVFLVARTKAAIQRGVQGRVVVDLVVLALCLFGGFERGWYVVPAARVFSVGDFVSRDRPALAPARRDQLSVGFRITATLLPLAATAVYVWAPLVSAASSGVPSPAPVSRFGSTPQHPEMAGVVFLGVACLLLVASLTELFPKDAAQRTLASTTVLIAVGAVLTGRGFVVFAVPLMCSAVVWQLVATPNIRTRDLSGLLRLEPVGMRRAPVGSMLAGCAGQMSTSLAQQFDAFDRLISGGCGRPHSPRDFVPLER